MKIIEEVINNLNLLERFKSNGTGRGFLIIVGAIILAFLHPEEAKKYMEMVALALIYGASNIFRKEKVVIGMDKEEVIQKMILKKSGITKETMDRLIDITTLDDVDNHKYYLDPVTKNKYKQNKDTKEICQII